VLQNRNKQTNWTEKPLFKLYIWILFKITYFLYFSCNDSWKSS